eukprot:TRINITY_DN108909_c0_g1_i1.p2 TRINITY_DN108909_c0_g1~~TRINITY_DN108909_c0_g1_i1.p2  ORF type:complete len:224 (+),score=66.03 TRINITY_DN108909_c0_g1_i1:68-673(+)
MAGRRLAAVSRRRLCASALSLALACLTSTLAATAFAGLSCQAPVARRGLRLFATESKQVTKKGNERGDNPSEEAIKTRGIFMSLDSDEFGIDSEELKMTDIPTEETEKDLGMKLGDFSTGRLVVPLFTIAVVAFTYFSFFTKDAEDKYYYSAMGERAKLSMDEPGVDFRAFDVSTVNELKKEKDKQMAGQEQGSGVLGGLR